MLFISLNWSNIVEGPLNIEHTQDICFLVFAYKLEFPFMSGKSDMWILTESSWISAHR